MKINCAIDEGYEISPRFRQTVEDRIARLERDAASDEAMVTLLDDPDHIRRQMRLVVAQQSEALRMRIFLDRAKNRLPRPLIALEEQRSGFRSQGSGTARLNRLIRANVDARLPLLTPLLSASPFSSRKIWSTGRGSNPRIQVLQTCALATSPPMLERQLSGMRFQVSAFSCRVCPCGLSKTPHSLASPIRNLIPET